MKRTILYLLSICNSLLAASAPAQPAPAATVPTVVISPIFHNSPTTTATNKSDQNQLQNQESRINVTTTITHIFKLEWPELKFPTRSNLYDYAANSGTYIQTQLYENKWTIIAATLATTYSWMLYHIKQTEKMISNCDSWCNWKAVVPTTHLILSLPQDLRQQLKIDLHKKYALLSNDVSASNLTMMFINEIKEEISQLNQYLQIHKLATQIWCSRLFWFQYDCNFIEEKKNRLLFVLDLFMASYAQD